MLFKDSEYAVIVMGIVMYCTVHFGGDFTYRHHSHLRKYTLLHCKANNLVSEILDMTKSGKWGQFALASSLEILGTRPPVLHDLRSSSN